MALRVRNTAQITRREGRYQWRLYLEGPAEELDEVQEVEYILHPTFRNPVRVVRDRASGFALDSVGWGEFEVGVEVRKESGEVQTMRHRLDLST